MRVVAALNGAGERCAVRVRTHKNLTAGKILTWLTLVDDTAKKVIEEHQRAGTAHEIDRAQAVAWAGAETGLSLIPYGNEPEGMGVSQAVGDVGIGLSGMQMLS